MADRELDNGRTETNPENLTATVREVVAVFERADDYELALEELQSSGFDHADISLLATDAAVEEKLSHRYSRVEPMEDQPDVPRTAYVSTPDIGDARGAAIGGLTYIGATVAAGAVVASGGTLAAVVASAVASGGVGGLLGALIAKWIGDRHAKSIEEQLEAGGLLAWVRIRDDEHERRAMEILSHYTTHDVHVHEINREWYPADRPLANVQLDPFLEPYPKPDANKASGG